MRDDQTINRISLLLRHQTIVSAYRLSYNFHHNFKLKIESKEARIKRMPRGLTRVSYGGISVHHTIPCYNAAFTHILSRMI